MADSEKLTSRSEVWRKNRDKSRLNAREALQKVLDDPGATNSAKIQAARALEMALRPRARKSRVQKRDTEKLTAEDVAAMRVRLRGEPGLELLAERRSEETFVEEFKHRCERSLYFFTKFCGIAPDLTPTLHKTAANWLQNWPPCGGEVERTKLFMMPTQHLKTSIASHGLPLHLVIQPQENNLYFPGMLGRDVRVAMIGESADKAEENLSVVEEHLESNIWIRNLWPECVWPDKKGKKWSAKFATIPRNVVRGEPTFTALGVGTKLYQRHYDAILCDDIVGWDAAGSPDVMREANEWRRGLLTRRHSPLTSIMLFIGTHFTPTDIYVSLKSELAKEQVISRSIVEKGVPIWPERFPMSIVEQLKKSLGARLFSHLMMNMPTSEGFTGFDWNFVRLFEFEYGDDSLSGNVVFAEDEVDDEIKAIYQDPIARIVSRWKRGEPLSSLYPSSPQEFFDPYKEENRKQFDAMTPEQQTRLKQFDYLRSRHGEHGPYPDLFPISRGDGGSVEGENAEGFNEVTFRDSLHGAGQLRAGVPTTRIHRADPYKPVH